MFDLQAYLDDGGLTLSDDGVTEREGNVPEGAERSPPQSSMFDEEAAKRLGLALGTLSKRVGHGRVRFAVGRAPNINPRLRDGVVRGLILSGQDVLDVGEVSEPAWAQSATAPEVTAGVYVGWRGETTRLRLMLGGALNADRRADLATVFSEGRFSSGEGSLVMQEP